MNLNQEEFLNQDSLAETLTFEQAMENLEIIVNKLETGELPLEKAIELFQQGMNLSRFCGKKLAQVERRIETLVETDGELSTKPFSVPNPES